MIYNIIALGYLLYSVNDILNTVQSLIKRDISLSSVLNCPKCYSFWIVLITSQSLVYASLVSLVVFLLDSFITTKL